MSKINPQAAALNQSLSDSNSAIYELLSERGMAIFWPRLGILGQTADAKGKKYNATIGLACEEDGTIMALKGIADKVGLDKQLVFPYAPSPGNKKLREVWQQQILKKNPSIDTAISLPVVTCALTHGLSMAGYLFTDAKTEIVLAEPFWGNYRLTFNVAYGASLISFPLFNDQGFNIEGLKKTLNQGSAKKILLLNFPNNPTGYTPTNEEADKLVTILADYVKENPLVVLCDDAYFGLVYEPGVFTESIFAKLCNLHENLLAVKLDGCTKEDFAWGFRVGFITFGCKDGTKEFYSALEDKAAGAVRGTISNAPNISQALLMKGFASTGYEKEKAGKRALVQARYKEIKKILLEKTEYKKFFKPLPFNSGYFVCLKLAGQLEAEQIRQLLLKKYDTGLISVGNLIRIAFSSMPKEKISKLLDNVFKACQELTK